MSSRHLPAGQAIPGGAGAGAVAGGGVGGGVGGAMGEMPPVHGGGRGGRRGMPHGQTFAPQYQQPMYGGYYMYPNYYQQMGPAPYQNGMPSPGYMSHQQYTRSPPSMQQYVPMVGVSVPPSYSRASQHSPALSTPYQPPPMPPHTPGSSSSHSQAMPPPLTPPTPQTQEPVPPEPAAEPVVERPRSPYRPPLPWLSRPDEPFPERRTKSRRRRKLLATDEKAVSLPTEQHEGNIEKGQPAEATVPEGTGEDSLPTPVSTPAQPASSSSVTASRSEVHTPSTQELPPDSAVTESPVTPSSSQLASAPTNASVTPTATSKPRVAVPAVPILPVIPKTGSKDARPGSSDATSQKAAETPVDGPAAAAAAPDASAPAASQDDAKAEEKPAPAPPVKQAPKSWASLLASSKPATSQPPAANGGSAAPASESGSGRADGQSMGNGRPLFPMSSNNSLSEALVSYDVESREKIAFIEPRGLINTGNMCYMNSVLQVLIFCGPFYEFLDQVSKKAAHRFKSDTPLIDAMILFLREFKVIDAAATVELLRRRLKTEELERYGDAFTPDNVYEVIRNHPRFATMRRGHQQDAEEFLGFLLQSLDDECTRAMATTSGTNSASTPTFATKADKDDEGSGWLEVGKRQRAAVTRSSGPSSTSPIFKIFGGILRSELRVPGLKDSVTTEPFQPLQLDIGSPKVHNILDALRGLTASESLQGDFGSPRGKDVTANKQVLIDSLPPVLILHLKRFQFDAEGNGTVKVWKKVGYPLDLEIPSQVFSRQKRNALVAEGAGMPKYKLIAVVYHHGKNASGGHYTADVRRQDDREWINLDDTAIRRVASEDVAAYGAEDQPGRDGRKETAPAPAANRFGAINDEDTGDEDGWKQVSSVNGNKRWSSVVNGGAAAGAAKGKQMKESVRDNKVAYLLFYQRV